MRQHGWFRPHVRGLTAISSTTLREGGGWWIPGSQLDLDFANNRAFNRSTGFNGSPNGILTYTSPSPKLVYGDDGVLGYAPHNLLLQSDNLLSTWTPTLATISSAELFLETASSGQHRVQQSFAALVGMEYVIKVKLKGEGRDWARVGLVGTGALVAFFNLTGGGAVGTISGGLAASITGPDSDGFFSCTVAGAIADNASSSIYVNGATSDTVTTYLGDVAKGVRVKNAHVYRAPNHSNTYIPTTTAAVYSLPIDHNPTTFKPLGVLIEEQRTNLLLQSQTFNTTWNTGGNSVTPDQISAPDGTTTADMITMIASSAVFQSVTVAASTAYMFSFWVKRGTKTNLQYRIYDNSNAANIIAATSYYSQTSSSLWTRITLAFTTPPGCVSVRCYVDDSSDGAAGTLYAWGAQLEAGAFATSYIPTVASQVTRAADRISIAQSGYAFNANAGTFGAEYDLIGYVANYRVVSGGSSYRYFYGPGTVTTLSSYNGSATITTTVVSPVGNATKVAMSYDGNGRSITDNGNAISGSMTDANAFLTASTTTAIGTDPDGSSPLNGHIKRLTYWNTRKTNAELQALSA